MDIKTLKPIPDVPDFQDWKQTDFIESDLVEVKHEKIDVYMYYFKMGFKHAEKRCLLRREAIQKLYTAAESLPEGYSFRIWDAYRPFALQNELFEHYKNDIIKEFSLENIPEPEQSDFINKFVARPKKDKNLPPAHTTGGTVDITLLYHGREVDMGCKFDEFTDRARTNFFETPEAKSIANWQEIQQNRRLLYQAMTSVGFVNLPSEIWHFSYGDRNWGFATKKPALYKGIWKV